MMTRTHEKTVTFRRPFILAAFDEVLPAGAYNVETDEELVEGLSFPAYRRVMTLLHVRSDPLHPVRLLVVDPAELEAALIRDAEAGEPNPA